MRRGKEEMVRSLCTVCALGQVLEGWLWAPNQAEGGCVGMDYFPEGAAPVSNAKGSRHRQEKV